MFNLGFTELLLLGLIALIFIGPHQLPEVARTVGRLLNEWKRATSDFQSTITTHLSDEVHQRRADLQTHDDPAYQEYIGTPTDQTAIPPNDPALIPTPAEPVELPVGVAVVATEGEGEKKS